MPTRRKTWRRSFAVVGMGVSLLIPCIAAGAEEKAAAPATDPRLLEVRLDDGGRLRATIADSYVEIEMRYGTLRVPAEAIRRIEFARRLPAERAAEIEAVLGDLASANETTWQAAAERLFQMGDAAVPALLRATAQRQAVLAPRAQAVLDRLQERAGDEPLELREHDVLVTADCRLIGRIGRSALRLESAQFGPLELKLADARNLQSLAFTAPAEAEEPRLPKDVLPDPGSLTTHQQAIGQSFLFKVTGGNNGSVWGSNVYTSDSTLATVAVHAGVLKLGETGVVQVNIVAPLASYAGSTRHGITTSDYGPYQGAYEVKKPKQKLRVK